MRGSELLDKMELIDAAYVEAADGKPKKKKTVWVRWGAAAACVCLLAAAAMTIPGQAPEESSIVLPAEKAEVPAEVQPQTEAVAKAEPDRDCIFSYNAASAAVDAARKYVLGYFTEELTEKELAAVTPEMQASHMTLSGYAGFDGEGSLLDVTVRVDAPFLNGADAVVFYSYEEPLKIYDIAGEAAVSQLFGHDFEVYQWSPDEERVCYDAYGTVNDCWLHIAYKSGGLSEDQAKSDFQTLAECFTFYPDGEPDLSAICAETIPAFFDRSLTFSEAQADADFGAFMPDAVPAGFAEESIRRYKDQNQDYLSGLWTKGYDELRWQISPYQEQDAACLTGIGETENYDLSLYPIPRADSVPDALREIVDDPIFFAEELSLEAVRARACKVEESGDSSGWRMRFRVKFGEFLVSVSAKGVEPEWVYRQLTGLPRQ